MPSNFKALAGASGGEPNDPNFKNVTLLLHGDGSNGAQNNTFLDSSTNNFTITRNGNTTQGSFSPYGSNWSNYFDGSTGYLTSATSSAYAMGTGDFTIEGWFFTTASGDQALWDNRASSSSAAGIGCRLITGTNTLRVILNNTSLFTTSQAVTLNQWNHIAIVRASGTVTAYLNGAAMTGGSATGTTNITDTNMWIGKLQDAGFFYNGYISNFRVVKGTAVYTSAFTPPTTPLTAITNTSLLTCQSNRFRDGSTNNFTITRNGDVKVTNFAPFAPSAAYSTTTNGGSAYFDGTGDYLNTSSSFTLSSGTDFTLEFWLYPFATFSSNRALVETVGARFGLITEAGSIYFLSGSTEFDTNTNPISGAWNHIALTRTSGTIRIFLNGVQIGTASSNTDSFTSLPLWIGNDANSQVIPQCYMSDIRWATTSFYSSAFTPPTAPLTAASGTQLLVGCKNAAIFDNSMKNDLETVGNAQISTSVKKFGTGSMAFDGSGDYLYPAVSPNLAMGTGNFTVEGWIYATGTPSDSPIFECRSTGSATDGFTLTAFSSTVIRLFSGSALISSSGTTYVNQWVHLAVVRSSGTTTFYINGTSVGSTATTINWTNQDVIVGGGRYSAGSSINVSFTGYIDDFRITKGVARYTANFTAPTAPFPNK